jgi:hypothetical protein
MIGIALVILTGYFFLQPKTRYISIFLLFVLATAGFQLIPVDWLVLPPVGISKPYDWVLIFCGVALLFFPKIFLQSRLLNEYKNLKIFSVALVLLLVYSICFRGVEVSISIRVFRDFIFFIPIFLFVTIKQNDFIKIFRLIIYATSIASLFYCLQTLTGKTLLNTVGSDIVTINDDAQPTRFYNLPVFIYPVIFFFFFGKQRFPLKYYSVLFFINALAIILSQHRNLLLAVFCCYILHLILSKKITPVRLVTYIVTGVILFNAGDALLGNRFSDGASDLSHASVSVSPKTINSLNPSELSTTEFRWYMFAERLQYILITPTTSLFGIGFLTEDSRLTQKLRFNIGLPDDAGNVFQVDTGDIIWSVMVLQFGLLGIVCFIFFYFSFFRKFWLFKQDIIPQAGILYIVILFITSFYGTAILQPYTTCMVVLIAAYIYILPKPVKKGRIIFNLNALNESINHNTVLQPRPIY